MKQKQKEQELERFARYIWNLSPHNFFDRNYIGKSKNPPLDKFRVLNYIKILAKRLK